jgi:DNA-binding LacI/PurR family transcriptional regulator
MPSNCKGSSAASGHIEHALLMHFVSVAKNSSLPQGQTERQERFRCVCNGFLIRFFLTHISSFKKALRTKERENGMVYTMRDVGRLAGVSASTVSRVLNNTHYIADETRKRVQEVVESVNYYKNVHARRLSTGRSDLFGLVISEIASPYFSEVIRGFQAAAWDRGLDVLLLNTEYIPARTQAIIRKLIESDVRGVAIMTSSIDNKVTSDLKDAGIGAVFSNACRADTLVSSVSIDYSKGIAQAIEHVANLQHRRAAVIGGPEGNLTAANIKQALVRGLTKRGMTPFPIANSDYRVDAGASAVREILAAKEMPTVIFCGSDLIAMGAMNALEEAGVRVPEDISILGIDNISFAFLARQKPYVPFYAVAVA